LKEVVVVVNEEKIYFKGEALVVINKPSLQGYAPAVPNLLVIMDGEKELAVFQKWDWWRELEKD